MTVHLIDTAYTEQQLHMQGLCTLRSKQFIDSYPLSGHDMSMVADLGLGENVFELLRRANIYFIGHLALSSQDSLVQLGLSLEQITSVSSVLKSRGLVLAGEHVTLPHSGGNAA